MVKELKENLLWIKRLVSHKFFTLTVATIWV